MSKPRHKSSMKKRKRGGSPRHAISKTTRPLFSPAAVLAFSILITGMGLTLDKGINYSDDVTGRTPASSITSINHNGHAASRSDSREPLYDPTTGTHDKPSVPRKVPESLTKSVTVDGSWALTNDHINIPYSKTPFEKAKDAASQAMSKQTERDMSRLLKDPDIDEGNGFGSSIDRNGELMLTRDTMDVLKQSYKADEPSGFNASHDTGDVGNAYPFSQCTWWAYVRRHELGLPAGSYMGNGRNWAETARKLGYWVDHNPRVGDVVVFQPGQAGADGYYGHVGVVENVLTHNGKTYIVTSESSAEQNGKHFSRILPNPERFEYVHY